MNLRKLVTTRCPRNSYAYLTYPTNDGYQSAQVLHVHHRLRRGERKTSGTAQSRIKVAPFLGNQLYARKNDRSHHATDTERRGEL